jgi:hypothetical protein
VEVGGNGEQVRESDACGGGVGFSWSGLSILTVEFLAQWVSNWYAVGRLDGLARRARPATALMWNTSTFWQPVSGRPAVQLVPSGWLSALYFSMRYRWRKRLDLAEFASVHVISGSAARFRGRPAPRSRVVKASFFHWSGAEPAFRRSDGALGQVERYSRTADCRRAELGVRHCRGHREQHDDHHDHGKEQTTHAGGPRFCI